MNRRPVLTLFAALFFFVVPAAVDAQTAKINRIGFISPASSSSMASRIAAFNAELRDLGYVEGRNMAMEYRWGEGKDSNLARFAAELVDLNLDVIVVHGVAAAQAVRKASSTIAVICFGCGDVLSTGLVSKLSRPDGNITGTTIVAPDLAGKRLQLLQQAVPKLALLGVLWNRDNPVATQELKETEEAARSLGVEIQSKGIRQANDLEAAIASMSKSHADAMVVLSDAMLYGKRAEIAALAIANQLPATSFAAEFARAGGLMAYGPDLIALSRRAATYVDKILKGAKPADLPIEQPTKFELSVNLKTARALQLTVPSSLLVRADEIIE
jgi:putative ABC transport system substrate-binding protein